MPDMLTMINNQKTEKSSINKETLVVIMDHYFNNEVYQDWNLTADCCKNYPNGCLKHF